MSLRKTVSAIILAAATVSVAHATDVRHFKGEKPETMAEAIAILEKYNTQLEGRIKYELTPYTMAQIHQMSYSLENALQFIEQHLEQTQENLEKVHIASETNDPETVQQKGEEYLKGTKDLLGK
ncbi:hypothetical protein CW740_00950 [Kangiella profundi]|uniref:Uncharacterized protein n=1 Tax=Kangiella profundi TaxID=1561924 RepID=A0A2K9A8Y8_9GAMM|nr:DUF6746 family protein [Kangiella profundi]AUD77877.1 hypothetical protein CW740_00950 [Kangiella profundi]GGE91776.1 hypothetical protein GCM10011356_02370 [Kangiella profundi]